MENREEFDDEINLLDYIRILYKYKILISSIIIVSVITTVITSLLAIEIYQSTAAIIPASPQQERSELSALASRFGVSRAPATSTTELVRLLNSTILMEMVIKKHNLLKLFFKDNKDVKAMPENIREWEGIEKLKNIFKVNQVQNTGIIEIAVEYKDPKTSTDLINYILDELTDYMSSEAKRVADTNKNYLESLIDKNADPLIRQKIYSLIAQQIEISMMAEVKENFAFKVLDPPKIPVYRIRPERTKSVIFAFIISSLIGIALAFIIEYWKNMKQRERL